MRPGAARFLLLAPLLVSLGGLTFPAPALGGELSAADRTRIAEALRLGRELGDELWPGWSRTVFALLLITDDQEFLVGHPSPSEDFVKLDHDPRLGGQIYRRPRRFEPHLQATFPAVSGMSTIVIGTPENTDLGSSEWVARVLHEHFHQYQTSWPDYYAAVDSLGLAGDDETGMWMLDYPFPYDSAKASRQTRALAEALRQALRGSEAPATRDAIDLWLSGHRALLEALPAADGRYLSFQLWQEGIARYTELRVAEWAAEHFEASAEFGALPDAVDFKQLAARLRQQLLAELEDLDLATQRRVAFYPLGAATGLLLDEASPGWRRRYFEPPFALAPHFPARR